MITIYYNAQCQFELTEEEFGKFKKAIADGFKHVLISRLDVELSGSYTWAGKKPKSMEINEPMCLPDGTRVVKKFGEIKTLDNTIIDRNWYFSKYGKDIEELVTTVKKYKARPKKLK